MVRGNVRGGKAYKKGKKGGNSGDREEGGGKFAGREAGQDYARAMKILGNRRILCFCNDGIERVAKIRGGLCKGPNKKRIEEGDIVIISHRSFDDVSESGDDSDSDGAPIIKKAVSKPVPESGAVLASGRKDVVDILDKVSATHWRYVKKEEHIHRYLFPTLHGGTDGPNGEDIFEEEPVKKESTDKGKTEDSDEEVDVDAI